MEYDFFDTRAEHDAFTYSTAGEFDRAAALEIGAENPDQAWILTDRDVWHANPYYRGPAVRHPEDDPEDADDEPYLKWSAFERWCECYAGPF